jgi:hypothetical protein
MGPRFGNIPVEKSIRDGARIVGQEPNVVLFIAEVVVVIRRSVAIRVAPHGDDFVKAAS